MEDFNTKCYVMNNEEKLFQQKQSLETLFLLMKKTRAKKLKVIMFYHLQNLFWGFVWGVFVGGFMSGGLSGGFCPDTGLTPVTVHMSFLLPQGNFERRVTRFTAPGNPPYRGNFSPCEQNAKVAPGQE